MKKYKCTKCGKTFKVGHEITVEGSLCNECFNQLLNINNAKEYFKFRGLAQPVTKKGKND